MKTSTTWLAFWGWTGGRAVQQKHTSSGLLGAPPQELPSTGPPSGPALPSWLITPTTGPTELWRHQSKSQLISKLNYHISSQKAQTLQVLGQGEKKSFECFTSLGLTWLPITLDQKKVILCNSHPTQKNLQTSPLTNQTTPWRQSIITYTLHSAQGIALCTWSLTYLPNNSSPHHLVKIKQKCTKKKNLSWSIYSKILEGPIWVYGPLLFPRKLFQVDANILLKEMGTITIFRGVD